MIYRFTRSVEGFCYRWSIALANRIDLKVYRPLIRVEIFLFDRAYDFLNWLSGSRR